MPEAAPQETPRVAAPELANAYFELAKINKQMSSLRRTPGYDRAEYKALQDLRDAKRIERDAKCAEYSASTTPSKAPTPDSPEVQHLTNLLSQAKTIEINNDILLSGKPESPVTSEKASAYLEIVKTNNYLQSNEYKEDIIVQNKIVKMEDSCFQQMLSLNKLDDKYVELLSEKPSFFRSFNEIEMDRIDCFLEISKLTSAINELSVQRLAYINQNEESYQRFKANYVAVAEKYKQSTAPKANAEFKNFISKKLIETRISLERETKKSTLKLSYELDKLNIAHHSSLSTTYLKHDNNTLIQSRNARQQEAANTTNVPQAPAPKTGFFQNLFSKSAKSPIDNAISASQKPAAKPATQTQHVHYSLASTNRF
jgi:hypothetical protein